MDLKTDKRARIFLESFFMLSLTLALILGGLEIALRLDMLDTPYTSHVKWKVCEPDDISDTVAFHPSYGWAREPGSVALRKGTSSDDWSLYRHSSEGFRDTYDSGQNRVIILGDSFTEGYLVDDNATYPSLLDRWSSNTTFESYGVAGYGTQQQLQIYKNVSKEGHQLVILGYFFGNDVFDNVETSRRRSYMPKVRPDYELKDGELVLAEKPSKEEFKQSSQELIKNPLLNRVKDIITENLRVDDYILIRAEYQSEPERRESILNRTSEEQLREKLELTEALLEELGNKAEKENVELLIVGIPERGELRPEKAVRYDYEKGERYWSLQREMLTGIARNRPNTHYLDLKPHFKEEIRDNKRIYGNIDGHTDDYGHKVTAKVISDWLVREDYLENPSVRFQRDYGSDKTECP